MPSKWTHAQCSACWEHLHADREAVRVRNADTEICCWCGDTTSAGIYVRGDPARLYCNGDHTAADRLAGQEARDG